MDMISSQMPEDSGLDARLLEASAHLRLFLMGLILVLVLRFFPRGLLPEEQVRRHSRNTT